MSYRETYISQSGEVFYWQPKTKRGNNNGRRKINTYNINKSRDWLIQKGFIPADEPNKEGMQYGKESCKEKSNS